MSLMCQRGGGSRLASFDAVKHAPLLNTFVSHNSVTLTETEEQHMGGKMQMSAFGPDRLLRLNESNAGRIMNSLESLSLADNGSR